MHLFVTRIQPWCCDEENDAVVKELCKKYGINHITRTSKLDAKAGNINNALRFASGEISVILDPDHVPAPEFLDVVLPYFRDDDVAFVQVVQAYYNNYSSLVAKGAAQQTYQFYGPMMMCMHSYGTVQALGANCSFRRKALDSIGGHASGLAEDMHTAMQLHAKGWKSVYVPAVIARGLVPSTLSAYYKQQLKWSRGTFELLFHTYPRLFSRFTGFQKLHYFLLPFHYFGGFAFLLNFLIPVFSLFLAESPLTMDFTSFLLAIMPFAAMTVLIRQYVQKWVVEENERGFHLVGGLLQIGTWWVHILGIVYTIIGKKVQYLPTPKDGSEKTPFQLHIPNLVIILISLVAIIYGLNLDWSPFSFFMAGFALLNIFILSFVIYASLPGRDVSSLAGKSITRAKQQFWKLRHTAYRMARNYTLIIASVVIIFSVYLHLNISKVNEVHDMKVPGNFYLGTFPANSELNHSPNFNQPSLHPIYIGWNDSSSQDLLPLEQIKNLYQQNKLPFITIEPWLENNNFFAGILSGKYDDFIYSMAAKIAGLKDPVFLRFAQDPFNSKFQWSIPANNSGKAYIDGWKYLHDKFNEAGASNVVWVWSPGIAGNSKSVFPGKKYVDWIGASVLDDEVSIRRSFSGLYKWYHNDSIFKSGLPVLITEAGTLSENKLQWWKEAWEDISSNFKEIRGLIAYNEAVEFNMAAKPKATWNWSVDSIFQYAELPENSIPVLKDLQIEIPAETNSRPLPPAMRATVYDKGYHWFRNIQTARIKVLDEDIREMKKLGLNTILRTIPGTYDRNFFKAAANENMMVIPRLWAELPVDKLYDDAFLKEEQHRLVEIIKKYRDEKNIVAWNISNDVLSDLNISLNKPEINTYKLKYLKWLQQLVTNIKKEDDRAITVNVVLNEFFEQSINDYLKYIPADRFLVVVEEKNAEFIPGSLPGRTSWGMVDPLLWSAIRANNFIIPSWQDQQTSAFVSVNGLLDFNGRKKLRYHKVFMHLNKPALVSHIPEANILIPGKYAFEGEEMYYHALVKNKEGEWEIASRSGLPYKYEWYLVQNDQFGNATTIKMLGKGYSVTIKMPANPERYRLYLQVISGNNTGTSISEMSLPFD